MALSGTFTGPGVTGSVSYTAGLAVTWSLDGEWSRAHFDTEFSTDGGATWLPAWVDYGLSGATDREGYEGFGRPPPVAPGKCSGIPPGGPGLFRLRCVEFGSGWCNWTLGP